MSFTFPITPSERDSLLNFGLLIESIPGMPDLPMTAIVSSLLSPQNPVNLTALLGGIKNAKLDKSLPSVGLRELGLSILQSQVLADAPHDRKGSLDWKVLTALTAFSIVTVILRLFSRSQTRSRLAAEEWLIIITLVLIVSYAITVGVGYAIHGAGSHIWDISFNEFKRNLLLVYSAEITYDFAILFVRTSLLVFYYGLCPDYAFHLSILIVFVINLMLSLTRVFFNTFACRPLNFWAHPIEKVCVKNQPEWMVAFASFNVVVDCVVLLLPAPIVWQLRLSKRERVIVIVIFSVGTMAMVGSITRIFTLRPFLNSEDRPYYEVPLGVWSLVEMNLGIIATCIPALRHLVRRYWPRLLENRLVMPYVRRGSASAGSTDGKIRKNRLWLKGGTGSSASGTVSTGHTNTTRGTATVNTTIPGTNDRENVSWFDDQEDGGNFQRSRLNAVDQERGDAERGYRRVQPSAESQIGITLTFSQDDPYSQFEPEEFMDDRPIENVEASAGAGNGHQKISSGRAHGDLRQPSNSESHSVRSGSGSAVASSGVGGDNGATSPEESLGVVVQLRRRNDLEEVRMATSLGVPPQARLSS